MSIHDEHRKRLRKRFEASGLRDFDEHTVLELLLTYAIPRRDTNELSHRLTDKFGGLDRVLEAPVERLREVEGMGERSAAFLKLVFESYGYYERQRCRRGFVAGSTGAAEEYARSLFVGEGDEVVWALCLDSSLKLIRASELARGAVSEASIPLRKVVEEAALTKARSIILAHNHPGGYPSPSSEDVAFTRDAMRALSLIGVTLADHIVVGARSSLSMADSGVIESLREELKL